MALQLDADAVEARTQALGDLLLTEADAHRPRAAERLQDWLLTTVFADEELRTRALRFLDVLSALDYPGASAEAQRLLREYFDEDPPGLPRSLRWLLRIARQPQLPAPLVAEATRRSAEVFARRFITDPGEGVHDLVQELARSGRTPSFDLLGEAVVSEREARAYEGRYLALIGRLANDPQAHHRNAAGQPALQVSLKLSSLTHHFTALDIEGSVERVRPALERIAGAARDAGIGLALDMEQYAVRDVIFRAFVRVFGPGGPFASWPDVGYVLQAYLRDAEHHVEDVLDLARRRGTPFQLRLVKGAYWDYERINAAANRWPPPVWLEKASTDATFERLVRRLLAERAAVRLAVASHNARTHAHAEATAAALDLPAATIEHQVLHRTDEGMSRALAAMGWPTRDYVPVGRLLPGMAYLVRRILENSSQSGFLMLNRSGVSHAELLAPPPPVDDPARVEPDGAPFERAPSARWHEATFRADFERALASTRERWGETLALPPWIEVEQELYEVHSPSHPLGPPVGFVAHATPEGMREAVRRAIEAQPAWAERPVSERASVLCRAADLLLERGHEFAAWIVHEGGRDRAGAWAEIEEAVDFLRVYAAGAESLVARHGSQVAPRGVVAVIPPWNFSLAIPCGMTVAALVCGNAVVLKPAEATPLIAHRLVTLLHEAGVPGDVVRCVPGEGETAGSALVEDRDVAMVAFTGSRAVGTWMHEAVSATPCSNGTPRALVAEMGSKNPVLVFADADPDEAVLGVLTSAFGHANQKCSAASRVLVQAPIFEAFRDRIVDAAASWNVGPADDASTEINPIIDADAADRLRKAAQTARAECEVLLDTFERPETPQGLGPLIVQLPPARALDARTATEELFGPILVLIPFEDEADAFGIANGTGYGLTSGVFSRSPGRIARAADAIEAGHVYVNRQTTQARPGIEPFGGMHLSGTGPKVGHEGYLWAFLRRTDAPPPEPAPDFERPAAPPALEPARWEEALAHRVEVVRSAASALARTGDAGLAAALARMGDAAERELAPAPTVHVAGQHTELWHDTPLGLGLLRARGEHAAAWLAGALLGGNALIVVDSPSLEPAIEALRAAGVPPAVLRSEPGGIERLLALAASPAVAFAAVDGGPYAALARVLGPTAEGQHWLKALLSPLDGPQPGEHGFARRFAWPKVVAVRTLRHGADLAIELDAAGLED